MKVGPLVFKNVNGFVVIVYQASPNRLRFRIGCRYGFVNSGVENAFPLGLTQ